MSSPLHFYLTFNPYLNHEYEAGYTQAHEFFDFLKEAITKDKTATAYWGKIISKDRDSKLDLEVFNKVLQKNTQNHLSTHLYISDFRHLWVGQVKSVGASLPKDANTLPFYEGKNVEVWFEISDFILLEHTHEETANKLSEMYIDNEHSKLVIQGLSPFTTSVYYPCLVQDLAEEQYFDEFDDTEFNHLMLKPNPAILRNSSDIVVNSLHNYVFPEAMYSKIPHAAKLEIESAELDMMESRHHNMHKIAFSYLKALEIVLNDLIIHHIKRKGLADQFFVDATSAPPKLYLNPAKDYYITLKQFSKHFSISHLLHFMERCSNQNNLPFKKAFSEHKQFVRFCTKELADIVKTNKLIEVRNALAHGEEQKLTFKDANAIRYLILGGATSGLIQQCLRNFYKDKLENIFSVTDFGVKESEVSKPAKLKLVS